MVLQWFMGGEYVTAKEMRQIAEEYIGQLSWHLPLNEVARELQRHGFQVESHLGGL